MTVRGPRRPRRPRSLMALVAGAILVSLTLPTSAPAAPAAVTTSPASRDSSGAPSDGLPIHGAGSDTDALVTPAGAFPRHSLAAISGPAACTGWASETQPPGTISVYRTRTDTVETLDFRSYVRVVVVGEFSRTWAFPLLAIGAIAAKQNAWYWTMRGRDWRDLASYGGRARPIERVTLPDGSFRWQTTAASPSGPGLCWDLTDNPNIDQCYNCGASPVDPASGPRIQAALDATWPVTLRRPRAGAQAFFAPGYYGRNAAICPSMATQAEWESWFTGNIDFNQAAVCASQGESAAMLLRRFLSSALEIRDPTRSDLTGDGLGDVPVLRADPSGNGTYSLDPATADPAYVGTFGTIPAPQLGADPSTTVAHAVGRLDRTDRASLVGFSIDTAGTVSIAARSLDGPGLLRTTPWWSGPVPGIVPGNPIGLAVADITGDARADLLAIERAPTRGPDGMPTSWSLRLWVLATTDTGADPAGFARWAEFGPFPVATRFERLGDVDGDGRADLVFALGDAPALLVARASLSGAPTLGPAEPYGGLAVPANADDWRFFALVDTSGTGRDDPVVGATGAAAALVGGSGLTFAVQTAGGSSYPIGYPLTVGPLLQTWAGGDPALAEGQMWAGDVNADGRAELGVVNANVSTGPILASTTPAARLAIVEVRGGGPPPSIPVIGPGPLEYVRVVAPGDQSMAPPDSTLRRIVLTAGKLDPPFAPEVSEYTVVVPLATTTIRIRPFATHSWSRITVASRIVVSGTLRAPAALKVGANRLPIVVLDGGSRSVYTLTVVRAAKAPAPRITKLTAPVGGKFRVYWEPTGDGGSPITGWVVQHREAGTVPWTSVRIANPDQRGVTVADLSTGVTYDVRVIARTLVGVGVPTARRTITLR